MASPKRTATMACTWAASGCRYRAVVTKFAGLSRALQYTKSLPLHSWRTYYYAGGQHIAVREQTATTNELTYLHPSLLKAGSDHPALHSGQD